MGKNKIKTQEKNRTILIISIALFLVVVFFVGVALRFINLNNVSQRSPDEWVYTLQADQITQQGLNGVRSLIQEYNSNTKLWIYPPPTRVGYSLVLAGIMKLTNITDVTAGAYLSFAFSIISLLFLIALGLRFFNPWVTLTALLFMGVSPMDLAIARRTWQDSMFGCLGLVLIYLCCEITRNINRKILYIIFAIIGSYSLLIKEPGIIAYGLCLVWLMWIMMFKRSAPSSAITLIIVCVLGALISTIFLIYASGGISPLLQVLKHVKEAMPTNTYAIEYQSGPWYNFFLGLWIISPINSILCLFGIVSVFYSKDNNKDALLGIIFFSLFFLAIATIAPYCQNLRYISVLYAPFYLIGGLGLWYSISLFKKKTKGFVLQFLVLFISIGLMFTAIKDYQRFNKIFVSTGILDTSIRMVKEHSK